MKHILWSLLFLIFHAKAEMVASSDCCGYTPASEAHLKNIDSFIKKLCKDESECKSYLGLDPKEPWDECLTVSETILVQDYTQTYGSFKQFELLEDIFRRLPKKKTVVYRGTGTLRDANGKPADLKKGSIYVLPRFVSTSLSQDVAESRFANGVVMIISAKTARDVSSYSTVSDEEEHILVSGTKLQVNKIYQKVLPAIEFEGQMQPAMKVKVYEMSEI